MNNSNKNTVESGNDESMKNFIDVLRSRDTNKKNIMKRFMIAYAVLLVLCLAGLIIDIVKHEPLVEIFDRLIIVISVSIFILLFRYKFLEQKSIDYSAPLNQLLNNARKRYKPWRPELWVALFAAAIMGIPACRTFTFHLPQQWEYFNRFLAVFGIYLLFLVVAMLAGHLLWRIKNRPVLKNIDSLLKELNN
jgi:hypothetical protein